MDLLIPAVAPVAEVDGNHVGRMDAGAVVEIVSALIEEIEAALEPPRPSTGSGEREKGLTDCLRRRCGPSNIVSAHEPGHSLPSSAHPELVEGPIIVVDRRIPPGQTTCP